MAWQHDRIKTLEFQLTIRVGLIGEVEQKLIFEDDPIKRQDLKFKLQDLNEGVERSQLELRDLQKEIGNRSNSSSPASVKTEELQNVLDDVDESEDFTRSLDEENSDIYNALSEEVKAVVDDLRERLQRAKGKTFTFLLVGKTGVGKSSTLNSLMGHKVARTDPYDPCTTKVGIHETSLHGATVRVIDTPGLCDQEGPENDAQYIQAMRNDISCEIDAVFFVNRLSDPRVDSSVQRGMRLVTEAFGEVFWRKAVMVFTCSDLVRDVPLNEAIVERPKRLLEVLAKLNLPNNIIQNIPSVAVDNFDTEKLNSAGQTWIQQLYMTVLNRIDNSDSKDVFVLTTLHQAEKVGVTPLSLGDKAFVGFAAAQSGIAGATLAYTLGVGSTAVGTTMGATGTVLTGTLLISNPIGWMVVLGTAAFGGAMAYQHAKKNK